MKHVVTMNDKKYEVEVERTSAFHMLTCEEIASGVSALAQPVAAPAPKVTAPTPIAVAPAPAPKAAVTSAPAVVLAAKAAPGGASVTSPMPGSVFDVRVNVDGKVGAGWTMFVLGATKMKSEIVTLVDGVVVSINVKTGDTADTDQVMGALS